MSDGGGPWRLTLYVAGETAKCVAARRNLKRICEAHVPQGYELSVVDLLERPELSREHEILAVPTLVREHPEPKARLIGDLSDTPKVLAGLDLQA